LLDLCLGPLVQTLSGGHELLNHRYSYRDAVVDRVIDVHHPSIFECFYRPDDLPARSVAAHAWDSPSLQIWSTLTAVELGRNPGQRDPRLVHLACAIQPIAASLSNPYLIFIPSLRSFDIN